MKNSSAAAVVLEEFGESYFDNENKHNLLFSHHVKIKILKREGLRYADIEIPLWKNKNGEEVLRSFKASAHNLENGMRKEVQFKEKEIFTENRGENLDVKKIAIPQVREGTVIEYAYVTESPFIFNLKNWEFQSRIPKISSGYWATIPGNYIYNMSMKGYLKLSSSDSELVKECFVPGGNRADCARYKFSMRDVPAFIEEDYMTARSNFLSALNFELSEIHYFDGRVDKITKEWKDADHELRTHSSFGIQLRRGKDIEEMIKPLVAIEDDPLLKANKIYNFIKDWYRWNETYGKYCDLGIRKAFDNKVGNVGDINLSLIAALRFAGLEVDPVILSTRDNGVPIDIHPVLSDFNYVIAKINIGDQYFLADATDDFFPFGVLPERCLNGKGRVLEEKKSYWIDLKPTEKSRQVSIQSLKLNGDGSIEGTIQMSFVGYEAVRQRKRILGFQNVEEYKNDVKRKLQAFEIQDFSIENVEDISKPIIQTLTIKAEESVASSQILFNPFPAGKWEQNPFRSSERFYPVDFATPLERIVILNMEFPSDFEVVNPPAKVGLALPNAGGRYIQECNVLSNRLMLNHSLTIAKTLFSSEEYHYLKELFNHVIQSQNADLIFRKKP